MRNSIIAPGINLKVSHHVWETGHLILNQSETFESLASLNTQWVVNHSWWQITGKTFEKKKKRMKRQIKTLDSLTSVLCPGWCHQRPWNSMNSTWWISHSLDLNISSKWPCERQSWTILVTQDCNIKSFHDLKGLFVSSVCIRWWWWLLLIRSFNHRCLQTRGLRRRLSRYVFRTDWMLVKVREWAGASWLAC